jgi:hypothetical protein
MQTDYAMAESSFAEYMVSHSDRSNRDLWVNSHIFTIRSRERALKWRFFRISFENLLNIYESAENKGRARKVLSSEIRFQVLNAFVNDFLNLKADELDNAFEVFEISDQKEFSIEGFPLITRSNIESVKRILEQSGKMMLSNQELRDKTAKWILNSFREESFKVKFHEIANHPFFSPAWQHLEALSSLYFELNYFFEEETSDDLLVKGDSGSEVRHWNGSTLGPFQINLFTVHLLEQIDKEIFLRKKLLERGWRGSTLSPAFTQRLKKDTERLVTEKRFKGNAHKAVEEFLQQLRAVIPTFSSSIADRSCKSKKTQAKRNRKVKLEASLPREAEIEKQELLEKEAEPIEIVQDCKSETSTTSTKEEPSKKGQSRLSRKKGADAKNSVVLEVSQVPADTSISPRATQKVILKGAAAEVYLAAGMVEQRKKRFPQIRKDPRVSRSDFEELLRQLGTVDSLKGAGKGFEYLLPTFSQGVRLASQKRYVIHLPHSGREEMPRKTLRIYLQSALLDAGLTEDAIEVVF